MEKEQIEISNKGNQIVSLINDYFKTESTIFFIEDEIKIQEGIQKLLDDNLLFYTEVKIVIEE